MRRSAVSKDHEKTFALSGPRFFSMHTAHTTVPALCYGGVGIGLSADLGLHHFLEAAGDRGSAVPNRCGPSARKTFLGDRNLCRGIFRTVVDLEAT